jgi:mono/diheme cytochrome c family protein
MPKAALSVRIIFVSGIFLLVGCNYSNGKLQPQTGEVLDAKINYALVSERIFTPKCVGCHSGAKAASGVDLSSYENIMKPALVVPFAPEKSELLACVVEGRMPKKAARLADVEIQWIRRWIERGAPRADEVVIPGGTDPEPDPTPTFAYISKYIFNAKCAGCHNGNNPETDLDLRTYESVMDDVQIVKPGNPDLSRLVTSLQAGKMPPPPKPPISDAQIQAIYTWIENGAENVTAK